ncbi:MAG TPA: radical SAM protein [Acidimicrobiales bacterium]|nr:radical SAM protein [Acidimicrobiales bacterium]
MKVLLLSTYELGHQPAGLAALAGVVARAGHEVTVADLSLGGFALSSASPVEAVVFSVPMHTATELALEAAAAIVAEGRRPRLGFVGLYAPALASHRLLGAGDLLVAGESGDAVVAWLAAARPVAEGRPEVVVELGRPVLEPTPPPRRELLPALGRYASYSGGGRSGPAASVEASRGCNHRCRHCPVAAVYKGRSRAVPADSVLADIDQVVEMGASHVSFSDPDFLNRPAHAMAVAGALHDRHPSLSFDATVKVEHLLRHRRLVPELAALGLSFVVSAFESRDDAVLARLDKGHVAAEEEQAVAILRAAGVEVRPSWLPFTPWTTLESVAALLEFSARADLVSSTDPVQYSIRLLLPHGSLLLEDPDPVLAGALRAASGVASPATSRPWRHAEPALDELQSALAGLVEAADGEHAPPEETFARLWRLVRDAGAPLAGEPPGPDPALRSPLEGERPHLSEAWFCCAEPTGAQLELVWNR